MRYAAWLIRPDGSPSPAGPSYVTASGIADAQRRAAEILAELQTQGVLTDWSIATVTEAP